MSDKEIVVKKEHLELTIAALYHWFNFQSSENASELYRQCSKLFDSKFDPVEYDNVE